MVACSPADVDAQITTDAAGLGVSGVGLTQHHPGQLHNVLTLPHLECTNTDLQTAELNFDVYVER